jgi:hypothetical protein
MFNNSAMGYIAEHTSEVRVASVSVETTYEVMTNGTLLIPPGNAAISVELINSQNFTVIQNVSNSTSAAGTVTSQQTGPGEIVIDISNAALGDNYDLTLAMKSPDGLRDFPPRNISLKCVSFETALKDFTVNGATAAFAPNSSNFMMSVPNGTTSVILSGTTLDSGATLAIYPGTDDSGTALANGTPTATTSPQTLGLGNNSFYLKVTAPSSSTQGYAVTIYRQLPGDGSGVAMRGGTSYATLAAAVQAAVAAGTGTSISPDVITLISPNITLTAGITIPASRYIQFSAQSAGNTISRGVGCQNSLFTVVGELTLGNGANLLTIDGNNSNAQSPLIEVNGKLTMKNNVTIKNNRNPANDGNSGGVRVQGGTFIMDGGTISGNEAYNGSGVYIQGGSFTMNGGTITDNGINSGHFGGGVYLVSGTFTMQTGAEISHNEAEGSGGGVYLTSGTFTMQGGTISGNKASGGDSSYGGGGVNLSGGVFEMYGGLISGNTVENGAVGAGVRHGGTSFTMSGGAVVNANNAVYLPSGKTITIGGTLTGTAPVATITPASYTAGTPVLGGTTALVAANYGKFSVTPQTSPPTNWSINGAGQLGYSITYTTESGKQKATVTGTLSATDINDLIESPPQTINILDLSAATVDMSSYPDTWAASITKIILPDNTPANGIYGYFFWETEHLEEIEISSSNPNYLTDGGVLYNKTKTRLVRYPPKKTGTTYTVDSATTVLGSGSFAYTSNLTGTVTLPAVTDIDRAAFQDSSVEEVSAPSLVYIRMDAFRDSGLKRMVIPGSIVSFGYRVFVGCLQLEWIEVQKTTPPVVETGSDNIFGSSMTVGYIYVPDAVLSAYQSAVNWSVYSTRIKAVSTRP